jgi:nitroreductase
MLLEGHAQYLIATAARAPSVRNRQPWRFQVAEDAIELLSDPGRRTGTDASGREMLISCGAALFGLRLAMRSLGFQPVVELLPDPAQPLLLARVRPGRWHRVPMNALEVRMLAAVPHRHTHRGAFEPGPLPAGLLPGLQNDAFTEGAELAFVLPDPGFQRLAQLAGSAARRGDSGQRARAAIRRWTRAAGRPERDAGPATAILLTRGDRRADWLHAGQALHRMLLHAASERVFASLYPQPLEDPVTRALIPDQLGVVGHPQMILQFGLAMTTASTARRPADELTPGRRADWVEARV